MDLSALFFLSVSGAVVTAYLDWHKSAGLIEKYGVQFEKNPVMRFFMGKSKWVGLAYKMWPYLLMVWGAYFHFRDPQNFLIEYANAPGQKDHWAIAEILTMVIAIGINLFGYLKSGVKKS